MKYHYAEREELCPECGHLMSRKIGNCPFCGCNLKDLDFSDFENLSYEGRFDDHSLSKKLGGTGWQIAIA